LNPKRKWLDVVPAEPRHASAANNRFVFTSLPMTANIF
jgi:hypothetical protein